MRYFAFDKLIPILALATLTACGGGDPGSEQKPQTLASDEGASVEEATTPGSSPLNSELVEVHLLETPCPLVVREHADLMYLVAGQDCIAEGPLALALEVTVTSERNGLVTPARRQRYPFSLAWNTAARIGLGAAGSREVTLLKSGTWREIPNHDAWAARDGAGLVVKNGRAYLMGGWLHGPGSREVWVSDNLVDWEFLTFAPWLQRHGAAWLVHNDRLFVIGGDMLTDVWSSADGIDWRRENGNGPFGRRYTPNAASLNGKLVLYAGLQWLPEESCGGESVPCIVQGFNDVWQSGDDGITWERINDAAPWQPRGLIHGSVVHDGQIFLIGGGLKNKLPGRSYADTVAEFNDIWSSPDGVNWEKRGEFPFPARTHFSVTGTSFGCVVSDGSVGIQANVSNNLYIAKDCVNFEEVLDPPHEKRHASAIAEFMGTLVILGGPPIGVSGTTVWQYIP